MQKPSETTTDITQLVLLDDPQPKQKTEGEIELTEPEDDVDTNFTDESDQDG